MFANEWVSESTQTNIQKQQFIEQILHFPHSYGNNSLKQKTLISICSLWDEQSRALSRHSLTNRVASSPSTPRVRATVERPSCTLDSSVPVRTEMIWGLFDPQCMRYMETSMKEAAAARRPGAGHCHSNC